MTPLYAFIPFLFPESVESKISIAEVCGAFGYLIAPVIGSLLYSWGGYLLPFLFFGIMIICLIPFVGYYLKKLDT
jgi:MFS family permease